MRDNDLGVNDHSSEAPGSVSLSDSYLRAASSLLHEVFQIPRFADARFLDWLYRQNPDGPAVVSDEFVGEACKGHYCVVPCSMVSEGKRLPVSLSLNTAVSADIRLKGTFARLGEECYAQAADRGITAVIGVANANSTPGIVRRLNFRLVRPLPVVIGVPVALLQSEFVSRAVDAMAEADLAQLLETVDYERSGRGAGWSVVWTPELLAWRLRSPASQYTLHWSDSALAVSTTETRHGVPFAILLKVFPRKAGGAIHGAKLAAAACRAHRAPLFVYCGTNDAVSFRGVPLPMKLRPRPLNMIYRQLRPEAPNNERFELGNFEFLDFDAY